MLKQVRYKGYIATQTESFYVGIMRGKRLVFHTQCKREMNEKDLKRIINTYIWLSNKGVNDGEK